MNFKPFCVRLLTIVVCSVMEVFSVAIQPWGHYSTIGFRYGQHPDEDQIQAMERFWKSTLQDPSTEKIVFEDDSNPMYRSATPSGAELWCAVTRENKALGFEPHFFGSSRFRVKVTKTNQDWSGLEAWLEASVDGFPLEFACPNYAIHKERLTSNPFVNIQLATFATVVKTFDTPEKYRESQSQRNAKDVMEETEKSKKPGLAMKKPGLTRSSKSFGLARLSDKTKTCHAVCTGHVIKTDLKVNEKTGQPFHWALVNTDFGDVDVVIDPNCLKYYNCSPPKVGGVIRGHFWLSGRIMAEPGP